MKTVAIVGAGPAGLFAADTLSSQGYKILIFDKGRDIENRICPKEKNPKAICNCNPCNIFSGLGGAGGKSDGKLNFHDKIGGNLNEFTKEPYKYINIVDKVFTKLSGVTEYANSNGKATQLAHQALQEGQEFILIKQKHIGSDCLFGVMKKFRERLEKKNVEFRFLTKIKDILTKDKQVTGVIIENKETTEKIKTDFVLIAPGRQGCDWFQRIAKINNINLENYIS